MNHSWVVLFLLLAANACGETLAETAGEQFWQAMQPLCGKAFEGRLVEGTEPSDAEIGRKRLIMHVRNCSEQQIRIPFYVGEDRSRTWVLSKTDKGIRLKHEHLHEDGTEDPISQYGGETLTKEDGLMLEFPADEFTAKLIPAAKTNIWTMAIEPEKLFTYALRRESGRRFRVDFNLTGPVEAKEPDSLKENGLQVIRVRGADLHYQIQGEGPTVLFVHGGLADYREWKPVAASLSNDYKTIVYSRRYNFPNTNPDTLPDFSAATEAEDLAALIRSLHLKDVNVVGSSYGAYTALLLTLHHPELVHTLIMAEPPLMHWLQEIVGGSAVYADFMDRLWIPVRRAFEKDDSDQAMKIALEFFVGPDAMDQIPAEVFEMVRANLREWKILTASTNVFPPVSRKDVRKIYQPALMLSGGKSYRIGQLVDPEIKRFLAHGERIIVAEGTHELCSEFPQNCADAIAKFLQKH